MLWRAVIKCIDSRYITDGLTAVAKHKTIGQKRCNLAKHVLPEIAL